MPKRRPKPQVTCPKCATRAVPRAKRVAGVDRWVCRACGAVVG